MNMKHNKTLQQKIFKEWFKKRHLSSAPDEYCQTFQQMFSDKLIDDMFARLDSDGGGTLDMNEITALLKENNIIMEVQQVANMFAEAQRKDLVSKHLKMTQLGTGFNKIFPDSLKTRPDDYNLKQTLNPQQFKLVANSESALKCK